MKKLYLAGPMTGYADYNYPAFQSTACYLRERGYEVINPAENFGGRQDLPREVYLREAMLQVSDVDLVVLLPGWWTSKGVELELNVARAFGIEFTTLDAFMRMEGPPS